MNAPPLAPFHAAAAWLVILALAVANGGLREALLVPRLGRPLGTALSGVILIAAIFLVTWGLVRWRRPGSAARAWRVGAGWLAATLAFEFGLGRLVQDRTWPELLSAYTFENGNLWPLVLLAVLVAPAACTAAARFPRGPAWRGG